MLTALVVPMLPFIRNTFTLDYTQSGLVVAAFSLSYGIAQLPAGWLADRVGPRILIGIGICGVALAGLLAGLSQTYITLIAALVLMGLFGGGYHPSSPPLISTLVEPKNWGRAMGFHNIGGGMSYFLIPLIGVAIATAWGWRSPFIVLAVPTVAFGIFFYLILGRGRRKTERAATGGTQQTAPATGRLRRLAVFLFLSTFTQAVLYSIISFIPLFMVDHFGVGKDTAGASLAIIYSAGLWVSPFAGHLSDRLGSIPVIVAVCLLAGPVIYLLNLVPYGFSFSALLFSIGIIIYVRMPVAELFVISQTTEGNRSTVLGIYYFSAMEGAGVVTPVIGYLIDTFGFYTSFALAAAALLVVTLLCSVWLRGSPKLDRSVPQVYSQNHQGSVCSQ